MAARENFQRLKPALPPKKLPLRELEPFACTILPVLLPLMLARVASEKSQALQLAPQLRVELNQGARNAQPGCPGLPAQPAAVCQNQNVKLVCGFGGKQRLPHDHSRRFVHKVVFKRSLVDCNLALSRPKKNSGHRRLAPARP